VHRWSRWWEAWPVVGGLGREAQQSVSSMGATPACSARPAATNLPGGGSGKKRHGGRCVAQGCGKYAAGYKWIQLVCGR